MLHRVFRWLALLLTTFAAVWALVLIVGGGFDTTIGGFRFSTNDPKRPVLWGLLTLACFVWLNGVERTASTWRRVLSRLPVHAVAVLLAIFTLGIGLRYSARTATAADAYGYVSQADLWLQGNLKIAQPWVANVPWPEAQWTFSPLGYRPSATPGEWALVPTYSPGLPMLMAVAKYLGGQCAMFLLVPLFGAVLALATYGIGCRLGSPTAGLIATWFVVASPTYLFMLALPMIDVPVAALWTASFYFLLRPGALDGLASGLAAGFAILVRPNLAPLAGVLLVWLVLDLWWHREAPHRVRILRIAFFSASALLASGIITLLYRYLFGSPFVSGYGSLDTLFAWQNILPNLKKYITWLTETQTVLALVGLTAILLPATRLWPNIADRRVLPVIAVFVLVLWGEYCVYLSFDTWWFLRFLLPAWPFMMLGLASLLLPVARWSGLTSIGVTVLVVLLGAHTFDIARTRDAFKLWQLDYIYVLGGEVTRSQTPDNSMIFSKMHSGSVRYYGGRMTARFDLIDKNWLDRAVSWLSEHGVPSYVLLDGEEVAEFQQRFSSQQTVLRLADHPVFAVQGAALLQLFALSGDKPASTVRPVIDWNRRHCAEPAAPPRITFQ